MEDNILIYVAGNPDAYPLEYYDPASESYQGVIPQLLARFSAQSSYQIVYYAPGETDQREQLAKNLQVDLLSGYTEESSVPDGGEEILIFRAVYEGRDLSCYLGATAVAPEGLKAELTAFLSSVSQQEITGILLETAEETAPVPSTLTLALGGMALAMALLAAIAALAVRHYRRKFRETQQELEWDRDTGLGNLGHLKRYYPQIINDRNRILYSLLYFYVDTDRLRKMAGSRECQSVMQYCAVVLREYTADTDILVRAAEDGFVMLKLTESPERLSPWIGIILQRIRSYPQSCGAPYEVHIAVGIYPLSMGDRDLDDMVFHAGQQARAAQREQQDWAVFSDETLRRIQLEQKLRVTVEQAMDGPEFQLYIQFYVDAGSRRIVGGEALSRWLHPEQGLLLPGVFVPILEKERLTYKLDYRCLRSSCEFLQELHDRGVGDFFLSCNFSRDTFAAADFVDRCREIIGSYAFPRSLLIFELTESVSVKDLSPIRANMQALKEYGVRIALDDFGEGFTSFADLQECPVNGIKLDKGLVHNIQTKTGNSILRAMIQVGHELGLTILAEGVETEEQARALQAIGCDAIQGFHFYAPVPQVEARDKLLQQTMAFSAQ